MPDPLPDPAGARRVLALYWGPLAPEANGTAGADVRNNPDGHRWLGSDYWPLTYPLRVADDKHRIRCQIPIAEERRDARRSEFSRSTGGTRPHGHGPLPGLRDAGATICDPRGTERIAFTRTRQAGRDPRRRRFSSRGNALSRLVRRFHDVARAGERSGGAKRITSDDSRFGANSTDATHRATTGSHTGRVHAAFQQVGIDARAAVLIRQWSAHLERVRTAKNTWRVHSAVRRRLGARNAAPTQ